MSVVFESPLRVSDRARARLEGILNGRPLTVRLFAERSESGKLELGLSFDERRARDESVTGDSLPLVADPDSLSVVRGHILDYEESSASWGFTLSTGGGDS